MVDAESPTVVDEWLRDRTGRTAKEWMDEVGELIAIHTDAHRATNVPGWTRILAGLVWDRVARQPCYDWKVHDENIAAASALGMILSLWACRVVRAKAYDRRRPREQRQQMMRRYHHLQATLIDAATNTTDDHVFFPRQEWHDPFDATER